MAVQVSKSGGIYIEISGNIDKLRSDLKEADRIAKLSGQSISDALSGALNSREAARTANDLSKYLANAGRAAKGAKADLSLLDSNFRQMGKAIGVAEKDLGKFADMQKRAYQNQASKAFENNLKGIQRLTGATDAEMKKLAKSLGGVGNEFSKATQFSTAFGSSLKNFAVQSLAVAGVAVSLKAISGIITESVTAFGRYEMLGVAMQQVGQNAGYSKTQLEGYELALRKTGIAMTEARQTITQLIQSNINLDQATKLARVAQNAAVIGGINSTEAYQRLIHGIQSGQTDVLRGIGLNVNFEQSYQKMATALNKTTNALTEAEKAQARANAAEEAGISINGAYEASLTSAYKQMTSLPRFFDEIKVMAGQLGSGVFSEIITSTYQAAQGTRNWLEELRQAGELENKGRQIAAGLRETVHVAEAATAAFVAWQVTTRAIIPLITTLKYEMQFFALAKAEVGALNAATASLGGAVSKVRAGIGGLVTAMGGPWVLAFTAAAGAVTYLATQEDAATKFARQHADAMLMVSKNTDVAKQAIDSYTKKLQEMSEAELKYERKRIERERNALTARRAAYETILDDVIPSALFNDGDRVNEIAKQIREAARITLPSKIGSATVEELEALKNKIMEIASAYDEVGSAEKALTAVDSLIVLAEQGRLAAQDVDSATASVNQLANALNSVDAGKIAKGIEGLQAKIDQAKRTAVGQVTATELISLGIDSKDIDKFGKVSEEALSKYNEETRAGIKDVEKLAAEWYKVSEATKSATKAARSDKNKTKEIAQARQDVELELAKLSGDFARIREAETAKALDEFSEKLKKAGINGGEAAEKIEQFRKGMELKVNTDHLQEQLDFYRDLRTVLPAAGAEYEKLRQQILDQQAAQLQGIGVGAEALAEWRKWQELRESTDAVSGLTVAVHDYLDTLTAAGQAQSAFQTYVNAVGTGFTDIITGAKSARDAFADMGEMIVNELARIAVEMLILEPIAKSLQSVLGGGGGMGGGIMGMIGGLLGFADGGAPNAKGLRQYANSVVTKPTIFPFANGGALGLMGEAGAEAIMPLSRDRRGRLGVSMAADGYSQQERPIKVVIENRGTPQMYDVQYATADEVRLIATDVANRAVRTQAPSIVAADMSNPNGVMSKGMASNYVNPRKRTG